jgi:hypothetical protein
VIGGEKGQVMEFFSAGTVLIDEYKCTRAEENQHQ